MGIADRGLIRGSQAKVIEGDPQRPNADGRELPQVYPIFAKNPGIHPLIEVHPSLHRNPSALQFDSRRKTQVPNFSNDLLETGGGAHIVIHEREIFFYAVQLIYAPDDRAYRIRIPLVPLEFGYAAETALADAAPGRIGKVGIAHRVFVSNLVKDAVVGNQIFYRSGKPVFGIELFREVIKLERNGGSCAEEPLYEPN